MSDLFESLTQEFINTYDLSMVLARVTTRKYIELGYVPKSNADAALKSVHAQLSKIEMSSGILQSIEDGNLTITLDDEILATPYVGRTINDTTSISHEDIEREQTLIENVIEQTVEEVIATLAEKLTNEWKNAFSQELTRIKNERLSFIPTVYELWGKALDYLDLLIDLCTHLGGDFNTTHRPEAASQNDIKFDALTRIHARSCQVAREIHTLLCAGFADGANARWRTLHELDVIATFLETHDNQTSERYLLHSEIEKYKLMQAYQDSVIQLGQSPIPKSILTENKKRANLLITKYGKVYESDYGWASHLFGNKKITLADIEVRPKNNYVSKVSHKQVHASSYGTVFPLSALPLEHIVGGSVLGLCEPGQQAAQAICSVTATLLASKSRMEDIISLKALTPLHDEIWKEFYDVEAKIRKGLRHKRIRKIRVLK